MALAARSILEGVPVGTLGLMTTTAFGVDGLIASIRMTLGTLNAPVLSNQGELAHFVVIEAQMPPGKARFTVTGTTTLALELATMIVLVAGRTIGTAWLPLRPLMAIETFILAVLTAQRPPRGPMVEGDLALEASRQVTFLTDSSAEDPFRMGVLVAGHTSFNLNGSELALTEVALLTGELLVESREWKHCFLGVIELETPLEALPIRGGVTVLTAVEITLAGFAVVAAVTTLTGVRGI